MLDINRLLTTAVEAGASDIHLTVGIPPKMRVNGRLLELPAFDDIVAEGVEEESQYLLLQQMGCDVIQGYYFSRPVDADAFAAFIQKEAKRNV